MLPRFTRILTKRISRKFTKIARFTPKTRNLLTIPAALILSTSTMTVAMAECNKGCKGPRRPKCGPPNCCNSSLSQRDRQECQDLVLSWFWNWDQLVNNNNEENQANYNQFLEDAFDDEWELKVHGDGWVDEHHKDKEYFEFQEDMGKSFTSSYSVISPVQFVSYEYDALSGDQKASFRGNAIGNMGVKKTKNTKGKDKLMQTHQLMEITLIKRANSNKWRLYKERSVVTVLEFADAV